MIITFRYKSLTWIRGSKNLYNVNFFACNCSSDWHDWRVSTQLPRDPTQCILYYFWRVKLQWLGFCLGVFSQPCRFVTHSIPKISFVKNVRQPWADGLGISGRKISERIAGTVEGLLGGVSVALMYNLGNNFLWILHNYLSYFDNRYMNFMGASYGGYL